VYVFGIIKNLLKQLKKYLAIPKQPSKMPEDPRLKPIRIQTGVVKRLAKEKLSYQKEAAMLEEKLEAFKNSDAGADDAAVARQTAILNESKMMIPDCQRRLEVGVQELHKLVEQAEDDVKATELYAAALEALETAKTASAST